MIQNYILFSIISFITNTIHTITGFGSSILAMPFAIRLIGRQIASAQFALIGFPLSLVIAYRERQHILYKQLLLIVAYMSLGALFGQLIESKLVINNNLVLYGLFILASTITLMTGKEKQLPKVVNCILLIGAGFMQYLFASGGPLVILALLEDRKEKESFHATINAAWCLIDAVLLVMFWTKGVYDSSFFLLTKMMFPMMIAGMVLGLILYNRINRKLFLNIAYILLLIIGFHFLLGR